MNASGVIVGPPNGASTPSGSTSSAGMEDTKLLASSNKNWLIKFVLLQSMFTFLQSISVSDPDSLSPNLDPAL